MHRKLKAIGAAAVLTAAAMLATAPAADAGTNDNIYMFEHASYGGSHVWTGHMGFSRSDCNTNQEWVIFNVPWPAKVQASSVQVFMPTMRHCNTIGLKSPTTGWHQQCVYYPNVGIPSFPNGWNDNVSQVSIAYFPGCPLWS